ncbi:MAG TPA: quinone-dependent dihydroorotate dehydrogenase [Candidatus Limnocylindria bacterium]|nr:quinone-dependent dihydroorotate dehydrogenase [Candidatus Limnocylindria bacterium]
MSWRVTAYRAVRPAFFLADAESVHHLTIRLLRTAGRAAPWLCRIASGVEDPAAAPVQLMGLSFRNRIGLGAGFDKDGVAIEGWAALGFGFVELGTVTPRRQAGNPRPRLFRLSPDEALINRMGFNNAGAEALAERIAEARPRLPPGFVVGVNIGRNRDANPADYPWIAERVARVADYLAVNVSSPNTPGLRQLQDPVALRSIVDSVADAAAGTPILVKLSPDLSDAERDAILTALEGGPHAGLILSNTTVTRPGIRSRRLAGEAGGLSGRPLFERMVSTVERTRGTGLLIASGGIGTGDDVRRTLAAGADLVQLWTGMVYAGPGLIGEAVRAC